MISSNFSEIPINSNFEEFPCFFDRFTRIVYPFPLYFIQIYTDQKCKETDPKFEETDLQIEMFKVFEKSRNG